MESAATAKSKTQALNSFTIFIYACQKISFRMLAAAVCALGISAVSDTSLRKHFSKASSFLHEMLHSMLSSFLKEPDISAYGKIKNVLLVDASVIRQDGKKQEQQRIHTCYSLNKNRICEIKVTDQHTAESLRHFSFTKDDLIMADAGYGTANNYIYAQEQQADVILRITPKNFCLYDADGNKISFIEKLKEAEKNHTEIMDISGFCKYKTKTAFVRMIAEKLPEEQAEKSRKRKKKNSFKKTEPDNRRNIILCRVDGCNHISGYRILWGRNFAFIQKPLAGGAVVETL